MNAEALQSMAELISGHLPDDAPRCFEAKKTTDTSMVFAHDPSTALFEGLCLVERIDTDGEDVCMPNARKSPHIPYAHGELAIQLPLAFWWKEREKLRAEKRRPFLQTPYRSLLVANFEEIWKGEAAIMFEELSKCDGVRNNETEFFKVKNGWVYRLSQTWGENCDGLGRNYFLDGHCRKPDFFWAAGRCRESEFYFSPPNSPLRDAAKSFSRSIQYVTTANGAGLDLQCGGKKTIAAIKELRALTYGF
jgi:hypothetical protein